MQPETDKAFRDASHPCVLKIPDKVTVTVQLTTHWKRGLRPRSIMREIDRLNVCAMSLKQNMDRCGFAAKHAVVV